MNLGDTPSQLTLHSAAKVPESASHNEPINILIVDDEPKNLTVLETILEDPGYRLVRAASAEEALLALVDGEFALLILDICMPGMTGFEMVHLIKGRKKTARVPIIYLTAYYNEDQHVLEGYATGAVDYLYKPVNPVILRSKVAIFAELYRKGRELSTTNQALLTEINERRRAEEQPRELNETLDQRVSQRTQALRDSEDQLREADRRKDEFLATLAHELRNPLAPVRNAVEILNMKGPAIPELQWARDVIERQVRHLARLIDDLMDLSRINRGKIELKREPVLLSKVVQGAIETSHPLIEECGHQLTVELPADPVVVDADLTRLSQVYWNLLNNAAKYMTRGGRIDLRTELQGSNLLVSVKDAGIGIPADNLATIFEMFSQVENALSRSHGGLGIGLYVVKRLVEMHGGEIEARNEGPGKGSEFVVRLPIVLEQNLTREANNDSTAALISDLRILVVDDNKDGAASSALLLKMIGNHVRTAFDGEEALQAAGEFHPHVVLLDIGLPKNERL